MENVDRQMSGRLILRGYVIERVLLPFPSVFRLFSPDQKSGDLLWRLEKLLGASLWGNVIQLWRIVTQTDLVNILEISII